MIIVPEDVKTTPKSSPGAYRLAVHDDLITVTLRGKVTSQVTAKLERELTREAKDIRAKGGTPVALIDATAVRFSDISARTRSEGRRMLAEIPIERWAVYGTSHLGMLVDYISKASGLSNRLRYFSDRRAANSWLKGQLHSKVARSSIGLITAITLAMIGTLGLIGWQFDIDYLTRMLPSLRPINPLAAVGLVALGTAFFCYWLGALKPLRVLGWTGIILGISALLPLGIDQILFADALKAAGGHTELADSAAVCFILSGLLGLLANREQKWVQPAEYTFAGLMVAIAAFNVYGQLYVHDFIYGISDTFVMALSLALAFLITGISMTVLVLLRRRQTALQRVTRSGWLIVIVLIFVQVATYASWVQTRDRSRTDSEHAFSIEAAGINDQVNTRLQAYVNALHGFRGLFTASTDVSQGDFEAYYKSLDLKKTYPGVRAIAFISAVKTEDIPAFIAKHRADTSLVPGGRPEFRIRNQSKEPLHFIGTYAADTPNTSALGNDLTSVPGRSTIYNNALKANSHYSSGTITYAATAAQPASRGFFIATPVRTASNSTPIGVVTANFNYQDFFGSVLRTVNSEEIALAVRDVDGGETIYSAGRISAPSALSQKFNVSLAENQSWQVEVKAPSTFGIANNQDRLAASILVVGQLFTLLLAGIFIIQIRARGQALALADAVTEDLQTERDNIAALHKKDEAMLAGLGEGLLVINREGLIEVTNEAASHILGYDQDEMIGKNVFEVLRALDEKGEVIPQSKRPAERALKHNRAVTARLNYIRKDYRQVPVKVTSSPIILRGELIGAIEVFGDISKEKQLEHMKDEFLSVASHELRTPMGAIRANLSMILSGDYGPVNKDLVEPLTDMKNSTIRLVELVSDLLNVARIEAGRMKFELSEFEITEATHTVVNDLAPLGKEKDVKVVEAPHEKVAHIQADVDKVKQILTNLIGNSLKFTDKGSISVHVAPTKDHVQVTVTDTGIGITAEDQAKLFGKFNQITSAQAGKPAGTGLGLYISREMVRKMGGDMWIEQSTPTRGSTFAFTLPYVNSSAAKHARHVIEQESKLHPDQV